MSRANIGPLQIDPVFPDATLDCFENWHYMQQHTAFVMWVAAFGGHRPDKYFCPGLSSRFEYDDDGNLSWAASFNEKIMYYWSLEYEDAGGGWRPTKVHWYMDDGTARPTFQSPDDDQLPDVGASGGGLVKAGIHTLAYQDNNPDSFSGSTWNQA